MNSEKIKTKISIIDRFLLLNRMIKVSGQNCIMPFYHIVSDEKPTHIKYLYPITTTKRFEKDLDFFLKNYTPMSASELVEQKKKGKEKTADTNRFFLSFDDGLSEFYNIVAPILLRKGIPATCFVNSSFVDNKEMLYRMKASLLVERVKNKSLSVGETKKIFDLFLSENLRYNNEMDFLTVSSEKRDILDKVSEYLHIDFKEYLEKKTPYLTSEQIKDLIDKGFTIGAHSVSHPYFDKLNEEEQLRETLESVQFLKENFQQKETLFSFPFTDFNIKKSFFEKIKYEIDLTFGTANIKIDEISTNLQRIPMERKGFKSAQEIVKTEYLFFILKKIMHKHIIYRD
ncbi:MAG: polysaccharide deacetylase family protein [Paludibacteraceae bacterium]